ncbi:hypothetical protein NIB75_06485 [Bacteroides uniformis]|nr:hypothetical protein [Bacteroides uniformis]
MITSGKCSPNELHAQMKMEHKDITGFVERNRWFNRDVVLAIASDYVSALKKHVGNLETRKCKGVPYKRVYGRNIFVEDLQSKLYYPLSIAITHIGARAGRRTALQRGQTVQ